MGVDFPDTCSLKNHGIFIICPLSILLLLSSQRHLWLRHAWRRPKKRPSEKLYPYELQHSRPHLMAPTTAHRKAWVLCTSTTYLDFKGPKKELLYEAGLLAHYCKHSVRDKTNLKAGDTRTPTHLLASLSYWIYWRTDRQNADSPIPGGCRRRPAVQFPANSTHTCCVELTLKGVLCTCPGRKGPLNTWALVRVNSFLFLPRPWWYGCALALGTARPWVGIRHTCENCSYICLSESQAWTKNIFSPPVNWPILSERS